MVVRKELPPDDHVSRFVPYSRQEREPDTDKLIGLTAAACELSARDKGGLSVNWIEFFGQYSRNARISSACAYRASLQSNKLPAKGLFAYAQVRAIKDVAHSYQKPVRVVHCPVPGNEAHSEIRHFDDQDIELLERLAVEVFSDLEVVKDLNLPPP